MKLFKLVFTMLCHANVVYAVVVCLSVTSRCSTEMGKRRIMQTVPHDSPMTVVFWCWRSRQNSNGVTPKLQRC